MNVLDDASNLKLTLGTGGGIGAGISTFILTDGPRWIGAIAAVVSAVVVVLELIDRRRHRKWQRENAHLHSRSTDG